MSELNLLTIEMVALVTVGALIGVLRSYLSNLAGQAVVYDLLFRTAAETLLTIAADPRHLGARIGATAVLHTWGSAMTHHPHIHMIVPGGGISLDGERWCRPGRPFCCRSVSCPNCSAGCS